MKKISKIQKISNLVQKYDVYKKLLTDKQRAIFELYYFDDNSLSEISELKGISRTAVQDMLKKTEKQLNNFEEKINIVESKRDIDKLIELYEKKDINEDEFVDRLKKIN